MRVTIYHGNYGCDTGCCGHWFEIEESELKVRGFFAFAHPTPQESMTLDETIEWAKEEFSYRIPRECFDTIDWSTVEFSVCDYLSCPN